MPPRQSGPHEALGSHPCVALSSCEVLPVYGSPAVSPTANQPVWPKAINPGVWGGAPISDLHDGRRRQAEHLGWRSIGESLMRPAVVVEPEIAVQSRPQLPPVGKVAQID